MRKDTLGFILIFLCGLWVAQLIGKEYFLTYGYLNPYQVNDYIQETFDYVDLFWNILWIRGEQILLIVIFRMTKMKRMLPIALKGLLIFTMGFLLMVCGMIFGGVGILVLLVAVFPQGICYFFAIYSLIVTEENCVKTKVIKVIFCMLLVVSGCILETVVGTRLLKWTLYIGNQNLR